MPLLLDSPARDAGGATLLVIDQRGLPRVAGSKPDIGAVELDLSAPDQQLHLMQARRTASGSIEIRVAASGSLRVVASSDPTAPRDIWDYLGLTVETPPGSGFFRFEDQEAPKAPRRFYLLLDR